MLNLANWRAWLWRVGVVELAVAATATGFFWSVSGQLITGFTALWLAQGVIYMKYQRVRYYYGVSGDSVDWSNFLNLMADFVAVIIWPAISNADSRRFHPRNPREDIIEAGRSLPH